MPKGQKPPEFDERLPRLKDWDNSVSSEELIRGALRRLEPGHRKFQEAKAREATSPKPK